MNLTTLTHSSAVCVQAHYASRDEAIRQLTMRLVALGKITDGDAFLAEVYRRESQGPTALGEGLAVPHGKSSVVNEAAFAVATLSEPLEWEGVDGPESVVLIVLLAIPPAEAGSTHIQVLTALTSRLADDALRERVMAAATAEDLLDALNGVSQEDEVATLVNAPTVICVTACPAGIAHTYMAAEYLEKAGRKLGVNVVVEKQGRMALRGASPRSSCRRPKRASLLQKWRSKRTSVFRGSQPSPCPSRNPCAMLKRSSSARWRFSLLPMLVMRMAIRE